MMSEGSIFEYVKTITECHLIFADILYCNLFAFLIVKIYLAI